MAEGDLSSGTQVISQSLEKMCVTTPAGKKVSKYSNKACFESKFEEPLSPPPTVDTKQKRERSESLMLSQTNDQLATKRRLRSRSRLGLAPEEISSAFMSPPCSSFKPRTQSRSQLFNYPEELGKIEASSIYMTPASEPREPLLRKDVNIFHDAANFSNYEEGRLSTHPSDSSDEDTAHCLEDKTRTKLNFEQYTDIKTTKIAVSPEQCVIGKRIGEKKVDFIEELVHMNCEEICRQIFESLEPRDLQRVASVSKLWRRICKKDRIASPRLDQYISGRKHHVMQKGKENLGHHTKFDYSVPQRHPFSVKDHNTIWTPNQKQSTSGIVAVKTNLMSTYERIKCPSCGSPSRKTENEMCECDECQGTFCTLCLKKVDKNHKAGNCGIKLSKSRKNKEAIGSKKSKNRLKRF